MASTFYRTDGQCATVGCHAPVNDGSTYCPSCEFDLAQYAAQCGVVKVEWTPEAEQRFYHDAQAARHTMAHRWDRATK